MVQYLCIGGIAQGKRVEVVARHELVEHVGTQHHGTGDAYGDAVEIVAHRVVLDDGVYKCQTATLAP